MGTYDAQAATSLRLIREKGKLVSLVRVRDVVPDPDQEWLTTTAPTEVSEQVSCVFLNLTTKDQETQSYMVGTEIHASDRKVLMAGAATTSPPNLKDYLLDGTTRWSIESVQELAPNGEQILYTLRVRR